MIPFGEWLPDLPDFQNPGATEAKNVIPGPNSYLPFQAPVAVDSTGGSEKPTNVQSAFWSDNGLADQSVFAGTSSKLFRYKPANIPGDWAEVTRASGGAYTSRHWNFAKFGTRIIAVNGSDAPQSYVDGSSTDFAALSGSPPSGAQYVAVVRDFVVMSGVSSNPNRVYWSAINNPEDWTPSAATQCDTQDIPEGGPVYGLVGGDYGLIFQTDSIWRMSYVGSPLIFQFEKIASNIGLGGGGDRASPRSIARYENMVFFYSDAGFMSVVNGAQVVPIGEGKVNDYFVRTVMANGSADTTAGGAILASAIDPSRQLYVVNVSPGGLSDQFFLCYHWPTGRWSRIVDSTGFASTIFNCAAGYDTSSGRDIERAPVQLGTFVDNRHCLYIGSNLAATLETKEAQIFPGRRAFVQGVYPIVDGGTDANITVALAARSAPNDSVTFGSAVAMNSNGFSPQRSSGRYHRARVSIAAGASWTHAQGIEVESVPEGKR